MTDEIGAVVWLSGLSASVPRTLYGHIMCLAACASNELRHATPFISQGGGRAGGAELRSLASAGPADCGRLCACGERGVNDVEWMNPA